MDTCGVHLTHFEKVTCSPFNVVNTPIKNPNVITANLLKYDGSCRGIQLICVNEHLHRSCDLVIFAPTFAGKNSPI